MNITSLFFEAAATYPERLAVIHSDRSISYRELAHEVRATAAYLLHRGIRTGDRVLVFVPMGIDLYRTVLALFYIGATAVFLDEWVSKARLEVCCRLAECRGFVGVWKARIYGWTLGAVRRIPIKPSLRGRAAPLEAAVDVAPDTPALITFTTGSTGVPKAAERSHAFLRAQFNALLDEIDPQPADVDMPVLPILLFVNLGMGCTSVIADFKATRPEAMRPERIVAQLQRHGVNRLTASPYFVRRLAERLLAAETTLPGLQKVFTGGAPVFPDEAALYRRAFPDTDVRIVYGSTEAEPISSIAAAELVRRGTSLDLGLPVGAPYPGIRLRLITVTDEPLVCADVVDLAALEVAPGYIGEIIVTGPHVNARYFRNPAALAANKIRVDETVWHRTGDSGFFEDGQLYITGRCAQLICRNDKYLAPFVLEYRIRQLAGVCNGTLLEIENKLLLVLESDRSPKALAAASQGIPYDELVVVPRLPRDPRHHSKIDYAALRQQIAKLPVSVSKP